jgi:hypothetical protein
MGQILQRYLKQLWQLASLGKTAFYQQGLGYQYISSGEKAMEGISIRQKLILGCVVPLLALLALLVGAAQAMSQLMAGMNAMYQGEVVQLKELKQINEETIQRVDTIKRLRHTSSYQRRLNALGAAQ